MKELSQFSLENFENAERNVRHFLPEHSLLVESEWLSEKINGRVYLKLECCNPRDSFKLRGGANAVLSEIARFNDAGKSLPGIVAASAGNHALAVSFVAKYKQVNCIIVIPDKPEFKSIQAILENDGTKVVPFGQTFTDSIKKARQIAEERGWALTGSEDDLFSSLGQGTIALELNRQLNLDTVDSIVLSVGSGVLFSGMAFALDALKIPVNLYTVSSGHADTMFQSIQQQRLVKNEKASQGIAKTLAAKVVTEQNYQIVRDKAKGCIRVTDKQSVKAIEDFLNHEKIFLEPAASCLIPAILNPEQVIDTNGRQLTNFTFEGKSIVLIICGSTVTLDELEKWKVKFEV